MTCCIVLGLTKIWYKFNPENNLNWNYVDYAQAGRKGKKGVLISLLGRKDLIKPDGKIIRRSDANYQFLASNF